MPVSLQRFWRDEAYLRQEFSRMGTAALRGEGLDGASRLEVLLARELPRPEELRTVRANIAASAALLPIAPEMAWAVPHFSSGLGLSHRAFVDKRRAAVPDPDAGAG